MVWSHQVYMTDAERFRELEQRYDCGIPLTLFKTANVLLAKARNICKGLLR